MTYGEPPEAGTDPLPARDRSWLALPPVPVDAARLGQWRDEVDSAHRAALRGIEEKLDEPEPARLPSGISVVVLAPGDPPGLARCLESLAGQTLDPSQFEIVVVHSGDASGPLSELRRAHSSVPLRAVRLGAGLVDLGSGRAAGIAAARRAYTTLVRGADHVSPRFLAALLACAGPRVAPVAAVVEQGKPAGSGAPGDSWVARAAPTRVLQAVAADPDLAAADSDVFWLAAQVRGGLRLVPCPDADGAVYYRAAVPVPAGEAEPPEQAVARQLDGAVRLELLAVPADVDTRRQLQERIGARADRVGALLRQHPTEHARAVAALDHRPLFRFPYHRMNGDRARSLVIGYAFPPYADTSATVTAKRVRARGELVDVVCNAMDRIRDADETLRRISGPFVGWEAVLPTPTYFSDWGSMEAFALAGLAVVDEWVARKGRYRNVYSRAHFAASHFLAAAYKLRHPEVSWSAEFSDPLSRDVTGQERGTKVRAGALLAELRQRLPAAGLPIPDSTNCFIWGEHLAYLLADELVFTNPHQLDYMLGYCPDRQLAEHARAKAVISPHPTLPGEFYSMVDHAYSLEPGVAHLAYFGNFYATRGLDDVLTALAGADPETRARLRLHVFTTKPAALEDRARELGVRELVRVGPYVRYLEFLNLTTRFGCLIVNDAVTGESHGRNPYLPSKWSDYRGSGTPVWGLVEPGSELSRQPLDYSSRVGDVPAAAGVLAVLAKRPDRPAQGR